MKRHRPPSPQAMTVLRLLAEDPTRWRHGYDLGADAHLKSGSLYPILIRLADRGLLEATWEAAIPGKPPRHLYRITSAGRAEAATVAVRPAAGRARAARRELGEA
jgi:PadR family transcriptional regulator, regulatory protein PadR